MATKRITERVERAFAEAKVDREKHTITGVLLCGIESINGRTYPADVLRRDHARYEGRPVNADHSRESTVDRRIGWFSDVRPGADGRPRGTFNVLKSHPMYERVMEAAERNPGLFGFSHVALCETKTGRDGAEIIERITAVESIDLVADPATTKGLFESREKKMPVTIKALAESISRNPKSTTEQILKIKKLAEDMGETEVPVADDAEPGAAIDEAFKSLMHAHMDEMIDGSQTIDEFIKKVKALQKAHKGKSDEPVEKPDDSKAADDKPDDKKPESRKVDPIAVMEDCRKQGIAVTGAELKALCLMEAVDRAAWMTDQRAKIAPETPKSGSPRNGAATRKTESKPAGAGEVKDVKSFLEAIRA